MKHESTRRDFLRSGATSGVLLSPYIWTTESAAETSRNDRPRVGAIGIGGRGRTIMREAAKYADIVAVCDVDRHRADAANELVGGKAAVYGDYRQLLDRNDLEAVVVATPDHWHAKISIEAMQSGKDVYCEKPLTLTIDEGKQICEVVKRTQRVFQVGTQQRTEFGQRFLQAIAMIRDGRLGELKRVVASTGGGQSGGPFKQIPAPKHLDWDRWLGQAPRVPYTAERCHGNFRWWREYAGGQMTDWGAHHVDIALWAIGIPPKGEIEVSGNGHVPAVENGYNMPAQFDVTCRMPSGVPLRMVTGQRQGILFEGDKGRLFVNRGGIFGRPVDALVDDPLPEDAITNIYGGKIPDSHMGNFFDSMVSRRQPISDVFSHHRAVSILHLANLCLLLKRNIRWDLDTEEILGDAEAKAHQSREQREGFEINV